MPNDGKSIEMVSLKDIPTIPKEWNITEEQKKKMKEAQKKVTNSNKRKKLAQEENLHLFDKNASVYPPKYPIIVDIKQKNKNDDFFLTKNHQYVFAESYDDAIFYVKQQIDSLDSEINHLFLNTKPQGDKKLRLSTSYNKKTAPKTNDFSLIKNSNYKYWSIIVTNQKQGVVSKFKQFFTKKLVKGGRKSRKNKTKRDKR